MYPIALGSGPVVASLRHSVPSHDQVSPRRLSLPEPPNRMTRPRFESYVLPAPILGEGPSTLRSIHSVPSNSQVSASAGGRCPWGAVPSPPNTTVRPRRISYDITCA